MQAISTIDLSYIAGIIDGEGSIYINKARNSYIVHCSVTNTNYELMGLLQAITGIGNITRGHINTEKSKKCYKWIIGPESEIDLFLKEVLPYLRLKSHQAELAIEFLNLEKGVNQHKPLSRDTSILKQVIFEEITLLNKRGIFQ